MNIIFGIFSRIAAYKIKIDKEMRDKIIKLKFENGGVFWFFEVWRDIISYFIISISREIAEKNGIMSTV